MIIVGAVLVVDRRDDIALARKIFSQVTKEESVARVAMGNDEQWIWSGAGIGQGVAHGASVKIHECLSIAREDIVVSCNIRLSCAGFGWIPYFDRQWPVIDRDWFSPLLP